MKKVNPPDSTRRNINAAKKRELAIDQRVTKLDHRLTAHVDHMVGIVQALMMRMAALEVKRRVK